MSTTTPERHEFQTEVRQLLDLMIHSLYSHKDIFLRELISNASDALDKLRFEAISRPELAADGRAARSAWRPTPTQRTLTVHDNGIGMTPRGGRRRTSAPSPARARASSSRRSREAQGAAAARADRPVRRGLLLELHGRRPHRASSPARGRRGDGHPLGVDRRRRLHAGRRRARDAGHHRHAAPQARGRGGRAARLHARTACCATSSSGTRTSSPTRSACKGEHAQLDEGHLGARPRTRSPRSEYREFYKHISHDWNDPLEHVHRAHGGRGSRRARCSTSRPRRPSTSPPRRRPPRRPALRQARVHHGRLARSCCRRGCASCAAWSPPTTCRSTSRARSSRRTARSRPSASTWCGGCSEALKEMKEQRPRSTGTFWTEFGAGAQGGADRASRRTRTASSSWCWRRRPSGRRGRAHLAGRLRGAHEGRAGGIYYMTGRSRGAPPSARPTWRPSARKGLRGAVLHRPVDELWLRLPPRVSRARSSCRWPRAPPRRRPATRRPRRTRKRARSRRSDCKACSTAAREAAGSRQGRAPVLAADDRPPAWSVTRATSRRTWRAAAALRSGGAGGQADAGAERPHPLVARLRDLARRRPDDPKLALYAELLYGQALLAEGGPCPIRRRSAGGSPS